MTLINNIVSKNKKVDLKSSSYYFIEIFLSRNKNS